MYGSKSYMYDALKNPTDEGQHSVQTFDFDMTEYFHLSEYRLVGRNQKCSHNDKHNCTGI